MARLKVTLLIIATIAGCGRSNSAVIAPRRRLWIEFCRSHSRFRRAGTGPVRIDRVAFLPIPHLPARRLTRVLSREKFVN